jgi:hypothetical protein
MKPTTFHRAADRMNNSAASSGAGGDFKSNRIATPSSPLPTRPHAFLQQKATPQRFPSSVSQTIKRTLPACNANIGLGEQVGKTEGRGGIEANGQIRKSGKRGAKSATTEEQVENTFSQMFNSYNDPRNGGSAPRALSRLAERQKKNKGKAKRSSRSRK